MTNKTLNWLGRSIAGLLIVGLGSPAAFGGRMNYVSAVPTAMRVQNSSFEVNKLSDDTYTINKIADWTVLPGGFVGVWNPPASAYPGTPWDGKNVLYINAGGVSQDLNVRLQGMADYSFSVDTGNRADLNAGPLVGLQLVAGGQVLASCAPPLTPPLGQTATVTLVYHSSGSNPAVGQNLSIQMLIVKGGQVNVDNVQVTFTDLTGTPASAFTTTQDCSITVSQ